MGLDEIKNKVEGFLKDEKKSDDLLDKAADVAKKVTGGKFDEKVDAAREAADKKIGTE
ncbi:antitoxin [Actinomyces minihominis]|uniref:antitoxin n=1 Tax=Actinomyces minihominis TaxID=2002838 RepID=UPI000C07E002|nr:antitoxin [Actinomyces minihominis]